MSRPAGDQIERKTIPSYYNSFNQFAPQPRRFPLDAKRAAELFNLVRDRWFVALKEREPPLPAEIERRIAKYRASFDKRADEDLPIETLHELAGLGELIASDDHQLPEEVCAEFALKGARGGRAPEPWQRRAVRSEQANLARFPRTSAHDQVRRG